jgi:hypothetical protein
MKYHYVKKAALALLMAGLWIILMGLVIMTLWNHIIAPIAGIGMLGFWQALGLFVLMRLLTGGLFRPWWAMGWKNRWKRNWQDKWRTMSPQERAQFRQRMCHKWKVEQDIEQARQEA